MPPLCYASKGQEMVCFEPQPDYLASGYATAYGPRYDICDMTGTMIPRLGWEHTLDSHHQ